MIKQICTFLFSIFFFSQVYAVFFPHLDPKKKEQLLRERPHLSKFFDDPSTAVLTLRDFEAIIKADLGLDIKDFLKLAILSRPESGPMREAQILFVQTPEFFFNLFPQLDRDPRLVYLLEAHVDGLLKSLPAERSDPGNFKLWPAEVGLKSVFRNPEIDKYPWLIERFVNHPHVSAFLIFNDSIFKSRTTNSDNPKILGPALKKFFSDKEAYLSEMEFIRQVLSNVHIKGHLAILLNYIEEFAGRNSLNPLGLFHDALISVYRKIDYLDKDAVLVLMRYHIEELILRKSNFDPDKVLRRREIEAITETPGGFKGNYEFGILMDSLVIDDPTERKAYIARRFHLLNNPELVLRVEVTCKVVFK